MTISIGITGSRLGATKLQLRVLMGTLLQYYLTEPVELHHGACIGVDTQAALLGRSLWFNLIAHPAENHKYRSTIALDISNTVLPELPYLDRDRVIVDATTFLIALPNTSTPALRSGTWYTYNYAQSKNKASMLILPDGTVI